MTNNAVCLEILMHGGRHMAEPTDKERNDGGKMQRAHMIVISQLLGYYKK